LRAGGREALQNVDRFYILHIQRGFGESRLALCRGERILSLSGKEPFMNTSRPASTARKTIGDIAPKLAELTEDVLFGDVWERPQLSKRDRSLVTCAALVATGKTEQMSFHFPRAIENGVTEEELVELITHLAFYAGWPNAMSAVTKAKELLGNK
jgi:4-carboxymuconolactone decarboxylase